ncbi:MAG: methyltransferase, partial [Candidatus Cloacimonetes bacterium]|nr:methyltransferase [Candidatus Cloacimonadota bacterium]
MVTLNLEELSKHLSIPRNRDFFRYLQEYDNLSASQIQRLINSHPGQPIRELLTMIRRQRKASVRITEADQLLFTDKGLEQSSSSLLASYHASKLRNFKVTADLTCGIGIDLIHLAEGKTRIYAADTDAESLAAARYNCRVRQLEQVVFLQQSAGDFSQPVEAIYLDPDRRPQGTRQISPEFGSPTLSEILKLGKLTPNILIKLSPALDFKMLKLPSPFTLEFISEKRVLKE